MKTLALLIAVALSSCAGLTLTAVTPYGDVSTKDGQTTIAVKPIKVHADK